MYAYKGFSAHYDLINFLNDNHIKKENIIQIFEFPAGWGLIYYVEE